MGTPWDTDDMIIANQSTLYVFNGKNEIPLKTEGILGNNNGGNWEGGNWSEIGDNKLQFMQVNANDKEKDNYWKWTNSKGKNFLFCRVQFQ